MRKGEASLAMRPWRAWLCGRGEPGYAAVAGHVAESVDLWCLRGRSGRSKMQLQSSSNVPLLLVTSCARRPRQSLCLYTPRGHPSNVGNRSPPLGIRQTNTTLATFWSSCEAGTGVKATGDLLLVLARSPPLVFRKTNTPLATFWSSLVRPAPVSRLPAACCYSEHDGEVTSSPL
jgi:hypothetical protein